MAKRFHYGGQAVIEGVMMRGSRRMKVAVRRSDGEIVSHVEPPYLGCPGALASRADHTPAG